MWLLLLLLVVLKLKLLLSRHVHTRRPFSDRAKGVVKYDDSTTQKGGLKIRLVGSVGDFSTSRC